MSAAPGSGSTAPDSTPAPTPVATPVPVPISVPVPEMPSEKSNILIDVGAPVATCAILIASAVINSRLKSANNPITPAQEAAKKIFEKFVKGGKGGFIVGLMVLALVNAHSSYVKDHPKQFMQDTFATAGFGAIAAGWLTFTRGRPDLFMNHFVFALMLFFLYHVCREFAGYFTVFGNDKMTDQEKKQENILSKPLLVMGGLGLLFAVGLAIVAHTSPDFSFGIFKGIADTPFPLIIETIVFVLIVTIGELVVARNKQDSLVKTAVTSAGIFTFAHLVLQGGGFYEHLYDTPSLS